MAGSDMQPVTFVSGTSRGIGRYLAEHLCGQEHRVIGCSRSASEWRHPNYEHHRLDVSDEAGVRGVFAHIHARYGRLQNLINNAAIARMNLSLLTPVELVERIFRTNFVGTFVLCREAARLMQKARYGRIVNFSTVAVPYKLAGMSSYASSKAAIVMLTEVLSREYGELGITVNAVGPPPVETDLLRGLPRKTIDALIARQAIRRMGKCSDVANVVDFFLDRRSEFVTGQVIYLGGGQ